MISIIVPVYNVEKYIRKCLDSILAQTYEDYELLIIDDGSTDGSGMLADEYANKDARISVIHKSNGGLSDARNHGIEIAKGEFICFIDSDDWIEVTYLEELLKLVNDSEADVAICAYMRNPGEERIVQPVNESITVETGIEAIGNIWSSHYTEYVVAWNKIYRRKIFDDLRYPVGMIHEDEAICADVYLESSKVIRTDRVLYNYRVNNSESIMTSGYSLKRLDILKAMEKRMEVLRNHELESYYEKDSFKYMYKILLNIVEIKKLSGDNKKVIKELRAKYWGKYRESVRFDWSLKRKLGMIFFGVFPKAYLFKYKTN